MAKEEKSLCKLVVSDYHKKHLEKYLNLVLEPEFYCKKCGRVAKAKKNLCKSEKI